MQHRNLMVALVLGLGVVASASEPGEGGDGKRAFEIADYHQTAFPDSPVVSPDGKHIAFSVTRHELAHGTSSSQIWMVNPDGSDLRQMTAGGHQDSSPAFSPDSKLLAFVSDRAGEQEQLFLMPVDGGEARQLTDFPCGVASPVFSPKGTWIAVSSRVFPECGADPECNQTLLEAKQAGPLKAYVADELLYRHWTTWQDERWTHVLLVDGSSGSIVRDLTPGRWDSPTFSLSGSHGYAFSPDEQELCFVSNHEAHPETSTNADLWVVSLRPGQEIEPPTNLTAQNPGWDGDPVYSRDGSRLLYRSQKTPGYEADRFRLAVIDRTSGTVSYPLGADKLDNWVDAVQWGDDADTVIMTVHEQGRLPLYRYQLKKDRLTKLAEVPTPRSWCVAADGDSVVVAGSGVGRPPELYAVAAKGGQVAELTELNRALAEEVDIRDAEELWVKTDRGYSVQVFVVRPHGFDPSRRYPLILNVHGGPQAEWLDSYRGDWQVYPGKGYVVAFANPTGSPGFGQEYVDAIACDWGGRVFDDLMDVTAHLSELEYVDPSRLGAMGWSYGGYMIMWFAGRQTPFAALASMMGVYDLRSMYSATEELWFVEHDLCGTPWTSEAYATWSPSHGVKQFATPTLVVTGEQDFRVPYTQSLMFFTDLQRMRVPSRLVVFPDAGHWPGWYEMAFYYLAHLDWFHTWLGGEQAPWDVGRFLRNQVFPPEALANDHTSADDAAEQ